MKTLGYDGSRGVLVMGWQDVVAIGIVALAAASLAGGTWRGIRGSRTKAESCGPTTVPAKQLVQIGGGEPRPPEPRAPAGSTPRT